MNLQYFAEHFDALPLDHMVDNELLDQLIGRQQHGRDPDQQCDMPCAGRGSRRGVKFSHSGFCY